MRLAAEHGFAEAQFCLGVIYLKDESKCSMPKALRWFLAAAVKGVREASNNLGVMYEYGLGVQRDTVLARMWYDVSIE